MRKTILTLALITLLPQLVSAQFAYSFTQTTDVYTSLDPAKKTVVAYAWTDPFDYVITKPFGMNFFGIRCDHSQFDINSKGEVYFTGYFSGDYLYASGLGTDTYGIVDFEPSEVSYQIDTVASERVLKVQFDSIGIDFESGHHSFISFQIWMYEKSQAIEFRYGPDSILPSLGNQMRIGLFDWNLHTLNSVELYGDPASPTLDSGIYEAGPSITGYPANGTVYRFTPVSTSVNSVSAIDNSTKVIYNPEQQTIQINSTKTIKWYEIYNLSAQIIFHSDNVDALNLSLSVGNYPKGIYLVKTASATGIAVNKIAVF